MRDDGGAGVVAAAVVVVLLLPLLLLVLLRLASWLGSVIAQLLRKTLVDHSPASGQAPAQPLAAAAQ
jgi:hypothetical protein